MYHRRAGTKHQWRSTLFPSTRTLEFTSANNLGLLSQTKNGSQLVVMITNRYSKLSRSIYTLKTSTSYVATIIFHTWITPYIISSFLIAGSGLQFVIKLSAKILLRSRNEATEKTAYHPQANGHVERYNETLAVRLIQCFLGNQKNLDPYVQSLFYAYKMRVNQSTLTTPSTFVLSGQPQMTSTLISRRSLLNEAYGNVPPHNLRLHFRACMGAL